MAQIHHFIVRWKKRQCVEPDSPTYKVMMQAFPILGGSQAEYIAAVTDHITRFSTAAVESLYPEVED